MKSVIRNLTGSTIVLPKSLNSYPLPANADKDFVYSGISTGDLKAIVSLAKAGSISFPGSAGLGIPSGFQVTPSNTYALNDQEPDSPAGTTVFSITDSANRTFNGFLWSTEKFATWQPLAGRRFPPSTRGIVTLPGDKIMLHSGTFFGQTVSAKVDVYDSSFDTWAEKADMPEGKLYTFYSILPDGKVLVCGGQTDTLNASATAHIYDPVNDTWAATGNMAVAVFARRHATRGVLAANGKVYVAGGEDVDNKHRKEIQAFDPVAGTWAVVGQLPSARSIMVSLHLDDDRIAYCNGAEGLGAPGPSGEAGPDFRSINRIAIFNPGDNSCVDSAPCPSSTIDTGDQDSSYPVAERGGRKDGAAFLLLDGRIVVAGGLNRNSQTGKATGRKSVFAYTPGTDSWEAFPALSQVRRFCAWSNISPAGGSESILIVGGINISNGSPYYNNSEILNVSDKNGKWVKTARPFPPSFQFPPSATGGGPGIGYSLPKIGGLPVLISGTTTVVEKFMPGVHPGMGPENDNTPQPFVTWPGWVE